MKGFDFICWGALGHAKVLAECLSYRGGRLIAVFDNDASTTSPFPDVPIYHGTLGFEAWLADSAVQCGFVVAVGGARGKDRLEISDRLEAAGLFPITPVHPASFVASDAVIGAGSQVLAQAAVCSGARLGRQCIVNTSSSVDHESVLEDGVHVAPGARVAGCVRIGACAMVGAGAVVLPKLRIGRDAIVGAGAVVTKDVPDGAVVVGNPARPMADRKG